MASDRPLPFGVSDDDFRIAGTSCTISPNYVNLKCRTGPGPVQRKVVHILKHDRAGRDPEPKEAFATRRVYPFENVVDIQADFELLRLKRHGVDRCVMPAHRLEIARVPHVLFRVSSTEHL